MKRLSSALASLSLIISATSTAYAESPSSGSDPAAAQALFYEARALMKDGKFGLACPKLEESLRLDYGIGTEFNLADCRERTGKLASAWSGFLSVAAAAKVQNQGERERVARDRAKALEPRLPKLVIEMPSPPPPGVEVKRDGVVVGAAAWGTPVPVDPGIHRVNVTATGKLPWDGAITAFEGKLAKLSVPRNLPAAPAVAAAPAIVAPAAAPAATPEREPVNVTSFPEPVVENRGGTQRAIGYVTASAGLVGLGISAGFGLNSLQKRDRSKDHCTGNLCDPEGVSLRDKAMRSGDMATVAAIAGGAALVGGIVLVLTAPGDSSRKERSARAFRAVPQVAMNGGGISLEGVLP